MGVGTHASSMASATIRLAVDVDEEKMAISEENRAGF
jgi:hypothetical protein